MASKQHTSVPRNPGQGRANVSDVELVWEGKAAPSNRRPRPLALMETIRAKGEGGAESEGEAPGVSDGWTNKLIHGDNATALASLAPTYRGEVGLIYADPPFATGGEFRLRRPDGSKAGETAYSDAWGPGLASYLQMLYERLALMRELLAERGTLYLHVDWRAGHYARVMLDELFGRPAFRNTIVWHYGGRGAKAIAGQFPRNHDMLLVYAKSPGAAFNRLRQVRRVPVEEAPRRGYRRDADGRWFKTAPRGDYTDASIRRLEQEGRIYRTRTGRERVKYFLPVEGGHVLDEQLLGDVWNDIADMMHAPAAERTGFPTQKPEALLARIIEASSKPGDLVADFFCGSGTTAAVAERLGRRWIACDSSLAAIDIARRRLTSMPRHGPFDLLSATAGAG